MDKADEDDPWIDDRPGWLDLAARVIERLLRSARFKADVRSVLDQIDPGHAAEVIQAAVWTDPGLSMAALAAVPRVTNALILGVRELIEQSQRFPPALLASFLRDSLERTEVRALGQLAGRVTGLCLRLASEPRDWVDLAGEVAAGFGEVLSPQALADGLVAAAGSTERILLEHPEWIQSLAGAVTRILAEYPGLVDRALVPLLRPVLVAVEQRKG